jgi:NAD dependent epimerase/dehydratase family enzyme
MLCRWSWAHVPWFAARILLGEVANTLVSGQNAKPKKLIDNGFQFEYGELKPALDEIVKRMNN